MEEMQKELNEMRNLVKGLKKKMGSDSESDWLQPPSKLIAATKVGRTRIKQIIKNKDELHTKFVLRKSINNLDKLISKNRRKHKFATLDSMNQPATSDGTPVTLASVYDPINKDKILIVGKDFDIFDSS